MSLLNKTFSSLVKLLFVAFTEIEASWGQPLNALLTILFTLLPIVMLVRLVQPENALLPILITLLGMVILVRLEQL